MRRSKNMPWRALLAAVGVAALGGCASTSKTLYQWGNYQPEVYNYFKGESKEAQIEVLERDLQKIQAKGELPPPGYHAHLGLLYADIGKDDQMVQEFETEKKLFPESTTYMDFLMKNVRRGETAN